MSTVPTHTHPLERGEVDGISSSEMASTFPHWDTPQRDAACRARARFQLSAERDLYVEGFMRGWAIVEIRTFLTQNYAAKGSAGKARVVELSDLRSPSDRLMLRMMADRDFPGHPDFDAAMRPRP